MSTNSRTTIRFASSSESSRVKLCGHKEGFLILFGIKLVTSWPLTVFGASSNQLGTTLVTMQNVLIIVNGMDLSVLTYFAYFFNIVVFGL